MRDWPTALTVAHHLLLSHGLAVRALRAGVPADVPMGVTLNLNPMRPAGGSPEDAAAAALADGQQNRWFLDPILRGTYPADVLDHYLRRYGELPALRDDDLPCVAEPLDFLGVNYYFPQQVAADPARLHGHRAVTGPGPLTSMGWDIDAGGLRELLVRIRDDYGELPIWITENGAAFPDGPPRDGILEDPARVDYLREHLQAVARAMADGVDVRRYHAWSLLDNFEWEHGYGQRFGIVHVDYETQLRVPKRSALWYRDFIASRRPVVPSPSA